jgi:atypical dual specificity phosphatase
MVDLDIDLGFVTDDRLRRLAEDYHGQAIAAHKAGAHLGTLVACGGVLEGVLAWALLQRAEQAANSKGAQKDKQGQVLPIEEWNLSNLIEVASSLELIGKTAKDAAWALKEFRNFIHPYRLIRERRSARADDALALNALTAVKEICRSLGGRVAVGESVADQRAMNFAWLEEGTIAGCRGPRSSSDLSTLRSLGIRVVVRLAETHEVDVTPEQVRGEGFDDCHEPIGDFKPPTQDQIDRVVAFMDTALRRGNAVAVSCGAGYGRTGTLLACYLVGRGASADEAIRTVRATAGRGPETAEQVAAIRQFQARLKQQP